MKKLLFKVMPAKNKQAKPEKKEAYNVSFFDSSESQTWSTKLQAIPSAATPSPKLKVVDIYSLNLSFPSEAKKSSSFIDAKTAKKIAAALKKIPAVFTHKNENQQQQVLLVADIKMTEQGYTDKAAIAAKENEFLSLFQSTVKPNYIQLLLNLGVHYVFMEGSLKADLLGKNLFSDINEAHLKATSVDFCQLVEFMINAFKRGEDVTIKNKETGKLHLFTASAYIKKIDAQIPEYQPAQLSYTIYPAQYHNIAMEGSYTKAMQQSGIFKITTTPGIDSKIVEMKTEKMMGAQHA